MLNGTRVRLLNNGYWEAYDGDGPNPFEAGNEGVVTYAWDEDFIYVRLDNGHRAGFSILRSDDEWAFFAREIEVL